MATRSCRAWLYIESLGRTSWPVSCRRSVSQLGPSAGPAAAVTPVRSSVRPETVVLPLVGRSTRGASHNGFLTSALTPAKRRVVSSDFGAARHPAHTLATASGAHLGQERKTLVETRIRQPGVGGGDRSRHRRHPVRRGPVRGRPHGARGADRPARAPAVRRREDHRLVLPGPGRRGGDRQRGRRRRVAEARGRLRHAPGPRPVRLERRPEALAEADRRKNIARFPCVDGPASRPGRARAVPRRVRPVAAGAAGRRAGRGADAGRRGAVLGERPVGRRAPAAAAGDGRHHQHQGAVGAAARAGGPARHGHGGRRDARRRREPPALRPGRPADARRDPRRARRPGRRGPHLRHDDELQRAPGAAVRVFDDVHAAPGHVPEVRQWVVQSLPEIRS